MFKDFPCDGARGRAPAGHTAILHIQMSVLAVLGPTCLDCGRQDLRSVLLKLHLAGGNQYVAACVDGRPRLRAPRQLGTTSIVVHDPLSATADFANLIRTVPASRQEVLLKQVERLEAFSAADLLEAPNLAHLLEVPILANLLGVPNLAYLPLADLLAPP